MRQQVSPVVTVVIIVVAVVLAGIIGWKMITPPDYSTGHPKSSKIVLPPSQVGTKLGKRILTNDDPTLQRPTPPGK